MSTTIEQIQIARIDLRGIIREALRRINQRLTDNLVEIVHADEQKQLASQKGPVKTTHIFGSVGRYAFGLSTTYGDSNILHQCLVSTGNTSTLNQYNIANLVSPVRYGEELLYASVLVRDGKVYHGVSPEDGVAEVLLGERRVSQHPHQ